MTSPPDAASTPPCPFAIGDGFSQVLEFEADAIRRVALEIGDANPLHHDAAFAATTRFGGLIASGGHSGVLMVAPITSFLQARAQSVGLEFGFRLRRAVRAGSRMSLAWRIAAIAPKPSLKGHLVDLEGTLSEPGGAIAITATCRALVLWPGALER